MGSRGSDIAASEPAGVQRIWRPPPLSRAMNLVCIGLFAALAAGGLSDVVLDEARLPVLAVVVAVGLLLTARAYRAAVVLDGQTLLYRGFLRSRRVPSADLSNFTDLVSKGWLSPFVDVPTLWWLDQLGRRRRVRLWLFALGPEGRIGLEGVRRVRADMAQHIAAAVQVAHRTRKHRPR